MAQPTGKAHANAAMNAAAVLLLLSLIAGAVALYDWSQTKRDPSLEVAAFVLRIETGTVSHPVLYRDKTRYFGIAAMAGGAVCLILFVLTKFSSPKA